MAAALGRPLPDWELPSMQGPSRRYRLGEYAGRILVLLFWAANPLCKRYNPYLEGFAASYRAHGITLLAVNPNPFDTPQRIRAVMGRRLPRFPILRDEDGAVARAYGVEIIPTIYVADRAGILRYYGAIDDRTFTKTWPDANYLEEAVNRLLLDEEVADSHNPPVGYRLDLPIPT